MRRSEAAPHSGQGGGGASLGVMSSNSAPHDSDVHAKSYIGMCAILDDLHEDGGHVVAAAEVVRELDRVGDTLLERGRADDLGDVAFLDVVAMKAVGAEEVAVAFLD